MRALLVPLALCLTTVALAGCADDGPEPEFTPWKLEHIAGDEPLQRVFRIEVDGDTTGLEWALDADGDGLDDAAGATFPGEFAFTYPELGQYVARASLSDGRTVTAEVDLQAAVPEVLSGTTTVVAGPERRLTGAQGCAGWEAGQNELDCLFFSVASYAGWKYQASSDGPPADVEFLSSCDPTTATSLGMETDNPSGTVPDDAGCAVLWAYGSATATMSLSVS